MVDVLTPARIGALALAAASVLDHETARLPTDQAGAACRRCVTQSRRAVDHLVGQPTDRARAVVGGLAEHLHLAHRHAVAYGAFHRDPVMDRCEPGQAYTPRQRLTGALVQLADRIEALADWLANARICAALTVADTAAAALPEAGAVPQSPPARPAAPVPPAVIVIAAFVIALAVVGFLGLLASCSRPEPEPARSLSTWSTR